MHSILNALVYLVLEFKLKDQDNINKNYFKR